MPHHGQPSPAVNRSSHSDIAAVNTRGGRRPNPLISPTPAHVGKIGSQFLSKAVNTRLHLYRAAIMFRCYNAHQICAVEPAAPSAQLNNGPSNYS